MHKCSGEFRYTACISVVESEVHGMHKCSGEFRPKACISVVESVGTRHA